MVEEWVYFAAVIDRFSCRVLNGTLDFVLDSPAQDRGFRILRTVGNFTRELIALRARALQSGIGGSPIAAKKCTCLPYSPEE